MGHRLPAALGAATLTLVILALAARPASARTITGTSGDDVLVGTPWADRIHGLAGSDDITGGKGDDRLFGGEGFDTFRWTRGDGYDQVDGGADSDVLEIEAGRRLRLHLNALGDGPKRPAKGGLQVIGLKRVEEIRVVGTDRGDGLVLSSDPGIVPSAPFLPPVTVDTGRGDDRIDVRGLRVAASITPGAGNDVTRLGRGWYELFYEFETGADPPFDADRGHDVVEGFGDDDTIGLGEAHPFGFGPATFLDTNHDGKLTAKDRTVRVKGGDMTIDLSAGTGAGTQGPILVTLVGRTSIRVEQIVNFTD